MDHSNWISDMMSMMLTMGRGLIARSTENDTLKTGFWFFFSLSSFFFKSFSAFHLTKAPRRPSVFNLSESGHFEVSRIEYMGNKGVYEMRHFQIKLHCYNFCFISPNADNYWFTVEAIKWVGIILNLSITRSKLSWQHDYIKLKLKI